MCNYYRKFIHGFANIAKPLYEVTKKETEFKWSSIQDEAFTNLKKMMTSSPVLQHFNPKLGCEIHMDASTMGIGAVILQKGDDNQLHPIAYLSRSLTKAEKNYTISELEALTAVFTLRSMRHLLHGRHIRIISDHHALCHLHKLKSPSG